MNCLVTKLNAVVNNDELDVLGCLPMHINVNSTWSAGNRSFPLKAIDGTVKLVIKGDGHFTDSTGAADLGKEKVLTAGQSDAYIYFSNGDYTIQILNKYEASTPPSNKYFNTTYNINTVKAKDLQYTKILHINGNGFVGKVSELNENLKSIILGDNANLCLSGALEDFVRFKDLEELNVTGANTVKLTAGDISTLGSLTKLKTLGYHKLTGSIEGFVNAQRTAGRTSVSSDNPIVTKYFNLTTVIFNGQAITGSDTKNLYWDATTITFDGVTITA